jgi:hypothetical protein
MVSPFDKIVGSNFFLFFLAFSIASFSWSIACQRYFILISCNADYSDESEHPIPTKVDSRFDDDFLG